MGEGITSQDRPPALTQGSRPANCLFPRRNKPASPDQVGQMVGRDGNHVVPAMPRQECDHARLDGAASLSAKPVSDQLSQGHGSACGGGSKNF